MDVDWGLMVAVLSMFFTMFIGVITIRYTKKSLGYTKKSTEIADESLRAAKKSVDTTIRIYRQQRINEYKNNKKAVIAYKKLISEELKENYIYLSNVCKFIDFYLLNYSFDKNYVGNSPLYSVVNNGDEVNMIFRKNTTFYIDEFLHDITKIDLQFSIKLIDLKRKINFSNELLMLMKVELDNNSHKRFSIDYKSELTLLLNQVKSIYYECTGENL
ncbi:TPA: hypothetical protein ACPEVW_001725 [Proteus mirabilis]|uniref:hypothetical protein n=2 Tax=Morganellaceae TaxID=1903414 RepID=UPI001179BFB0|nr:MULTISPECIES: hypothetical protein [Proteus]EGT3592351.1 hypothetical protein [Proteus mirabilis]EKU9859673.1 hypothetical protein [Proteus mirabilis]ELB1076197.1 hypothetical protein [Proteus mirabilis]MBN7156916.1 hypothetical protein [Proteus mirabilis]MBS3874481.1 hypothetical protein [Proteus mirabilis]